jgi:hypothetical protein
LFKLEFVLVLFANPVIIDLQPTPDNKTIGVLTFYT